MSFSTNTKYNSPLFLCKIHSSIPVLPKKELDFGADDRQSARSLNSGDGDGFGGDDADGTYNSCNCVPQQPQQLHQGSRTGQTDLQLAWARHLRAGTPSNVQEDQ